MSFHFKFNFWRHCRLANIVAMQVQPRSFFHGSKAQQAAAEKNSMESKLTTSTRGEESNKKMTIGVKVKETSKTVWYTGVVIGGFAVTGMILFTVLKELFWSQSPQSIYSDALKKCCQHPRICDILGEPIKGFCEESARHRRKNLRYSTFLKNGVEHLQIRFYIKGIRNQATVYADMEKIEGRFEYSYLMAEVESYPRERIFVLDNRKPDLTYHQI